MSFYTPQIKENQCPQARSGHTAVKHNGNIIIHGGYNEGLASRHRVNDMYMPPDELWMYNMEDPTWKRRTTSGSFPATGISGAAACVLNDRMIVFGGYGCAFGRLSLVYELDLKTLVWRNLTKEGIVKGPCPSSRDKFVTWVHQDQIIFFGGYGPPPETKNGSNGEFCYDETEGRIALGVGWNSDVCVLDFSIPGEMKWRYPELSVEKPLPRAAHAATKILNNGYIFGGRNRDTRVNDMLYLDLGSFKWHKVSYNSPAPKGRSWHVMGKISENSIFLHGGLDTSGTPLSDMWLFNTETKLWTEVVSNSFATGSTRRIWHTAIESDDNDEVIIFGGCSNSVLSDEPSKHSNEILVFRASPIKLEQLCIKQLACVLNSTLYGYEQLANMPKHIQNRISNHLHKIQPPHDGNIKCRVICSLL